MHRRRRLLRLRLRDARAALIDSLLRLDLSQWHHFCFKLSKINAALRDGPHEVLRERAQLSIDSGRLPVIDELAEVLIRDEHAVVSLFGWWSVTNSLLAVVWDTRESWSCAEARIHIRGWIEKVDTGGRGRSAALRIGLLGVFLRGRLPLTL